MRRALLLFVWTMVCGTAAAVRAESPGPGTDANTCGRPLTTTPAAGEVSANLTRIVISASVVARLVHQTTRDEIPTDTMTAFGTVVRLTEPLVVGETYDLLRVDCMGGPETLASFTAVAPVDPPTTLGVISVSELRAYYVTPGRRDRYHYVDVALTPDASMTPWLDAYDWWLEYVPYTTRGRPFRDDWLTQEIPIACVRGGTADARITGHASVFGAPPADLSTATFEQTYRCEDASVVDAVTRRVLSADEIDRLERAARDAGNDLDASATPDAGFASIDGGSAMMPTEPDTNGNCSASPSRRSSPMWLLLSIFGVLLVRRRPSTRARRD